MQSTQLRCVILIAVLAIGNLLQASFDGAREVGPARWPTDDAVYAVGGWAMGPLAVESAYGIHHVTRSYRRADGMSAQLAISTSPEAKRVFRAGADVPFVGSGYTVDPAPPSLVAPADGRGALLVRRENELGLLLHAAGERRGLHGSGVLGWGLAAFDATLGRPNDYYLARVLVPLNGLDSPAASEAVKLADTVFPRLAAWYGG